MPSIQTTLKQMMENNVNHPSHYTEGDVECIDAIKASMSFEEFVGYLKGNCVKYLWRYRNKGKAVEDLKKAQWYLERLISEWSVLDTEKEQSDYLEFGPKTNQALKDRLKDFRTISGPLVESEEE